MAGVLLVDDSWDGLAENATIHGRTPTFQTSPGTYGVDPNTSTSIVGGGSNTIKFNEIGAAFKMVTAVENYAVQLIVNDNGVNERIVLFLRDNQSTPYQRYGLWVSYVTREFGGTSGYFRVASSNNYSSVALFPDFPWTYDSSGINKFAFEANSSTFRVIINDVVATTFTNTTWPPNGARSRVGVSFGSAGPSNARATRFSVYDSIDVVEQTSYPVVRFG